MDQNSLDILACWEECREVLERYEEAIDTLRVMAKAPRMARHGWRRAKPLPRKCWPRRRRPSGRKLSSRRNFRIGRGAM